MATQKMLVDGYAGNKLPPLAHISKVATGPFRVMQVGTSIAANTLSAANMLVEILKTTYGDSGLRQEYLGSLGGAYNNVFQGWNKQVYGGPLFYRLRGNSSSTPLNFGAYFDQLVIEWSRETDSQPVEVFIDGVSVGTVGSAGAQAYSQKTTFTTTLGPHKVTINAPTSNYAYLEHIEFRVSTRKGVETRDVAMGGSMIRNMTPDLFGLTGSAVAGIPIVGDNGINAYFDRTDVDLFVVSYVVNDAGFNVSQHIEQVYKPSLEKIVAKTAANGKPLVLIIEMAGHFLMPNDGGSAYNYTNFNLIRDYLLTLRKHNHVTVIDWHGATAIADIQAYAAKYYAAGTVNVSAGTYTGDFVHPTVEGQKIVHNLIATSAGVRPPATTDPVVMNAERFTTLSPGTGMDKSATVDGVAKFYAQPSGPALIAISNSTNGPYRHAAYYRDTAAFNNAASLVTAIRASATSTEYGKYEDWSLKNVGIGSFVNYVGGEKSTFTLKASGTAEIRADQPISLWIDGAMIPADPSNANRTIVRHVVSGTKPITISVTVGSTGTGVALYVSGRVYDVAFTKSDVPILT